MLKRLLIRLFTSVLVIAAQANPLRLEEKVKNYLRNMT